MYNFTHLHVHTQFSILDGAADIELLISKAKKDGMKALAITDHGNMYGVLKFVTQAKEQGIKPIIGCEMYVAKNSHLDKKGKEDRSGHHLILLAKNKTGYKNLSKLSSLSFLEGFYYTPRIDKELLKKYHEGLIALSACLAGEIPKTILEKGEDKAGKVIKEYFDIFKDDFYLELHRHGIPDQKIVDKALINLAKKYNIKLIATNDVHFVNAEDAEAHDILVCLNTGKNFSDKDRMRYSGQEFLKTKAEMSELFSDIPEAISNTQEIVDKIEDFNIKCDKIILPVFPLPEGFSSEMEYLRHLTYEGAKHCYPELNDEIKQRLEYELSVIKDMGFPGYFLIVQDFIREAKKSDVAVGPGRGSAAGSAVAFCIGITDIDPIKYNLLFERFLNPERVNMPDIDIDFDDEGREKVIDYVTKKYGKERVAQIITFGTMAARMAIRDVARVLELSLNESDRLAKLVPEGPNVTLNEAFKKIPELAEAKKNGSELVKKTLNLAEKLEGSVRHTGTHACGIIIGPDDLIENIPLCIAKGSDMMATQYEGKLVESAGMLKMDFLGLKTLSIVKDAVENIYIRHGIRINIDEIPMDDKDTFELYQRGETIGTFQFESKGMRTYLKDLNPTNIEDLIAMNALYRPGPMDYIPGFIKRKQGKEKVEYPDLLLEDILKPTYGIMVYQEQIMQAVQIMGGFSLGSADLIRRAMGKKKSGIMKQQRKIFVEGAEKKGIKKEKANKVFDKIQEFAKYGFNRSHSAAYSVIAYKTAYFKAHYAAEYMAAVLTNNIDNIKKITYFIDECKRQNIQVLGPDINESTFKFTVNKKGEIRFGLGAIKGVGKNAVGFIIKERTKNDNFKDIFDLINRSDLHTVNKKSLESLAYAGAFDSFKDTHRAQYFYKRDNEDLTFLEKIIKDTNNYKSKQNPNQIDIFGKSDNIQTLNIEMPVCEHWTKIQQLKNEKEVTGFYLSGHPLDDYKTTIDNFCNTTIEKLNKNIEKYKNHEIKFAGIVSSVAHKITKNGKPFGTFTIEDYSDSIRLYLFSETYLRLKHFLEENRFLLINAKVQKKQWGNDDRPEVRVNNIILLSDALEKYTDSISVNLYLSDINDDFIQNMFEKINSNSGRCKLKFNVFDNINNIKIEMPSKKFRVNSSDFLKSIKEMDLNYKIN